jgi:hypothetical protein
MYKDPQLSNQAKRLREELGLKGLKLSQVQALEVLARISGAKTLHVAHARHNAALSIEAVVVSQAQALMFDTLGRFEGNVRGLLGSITSAFALESAQGSRAVENSIFGLFETQNAPKVSEMYDFAKLNELPGMFEVLVTRLTQTLEAQAKVTQKIQHSSDPVVFEGTVQDWRLDDGYMLADLPEHHRQLFDARVTQNPGRQLFVDVTPAGLKSIDCEGRQMMSLFIEINEGRPCVHMTNGSQGEQVLTVFFTEDGLYLRPDNSENCIQGGKPTAPALALLVEELEAPYSTPVAGGAFIEVCS